MLYYSTHYQKRGMHIFQCTFTIGTNKMGISCNYRELTANKVIMSDVGKRIITLQYAILSSVEICMKIHHL